MVGIRIENSMVIIEAELFGVSQWSCASTEPVRYRLVLPRQVSRVRWFHRIVWIVFLVTGAFFPPDPEAARPPRSFTCLTFIR